MEENIFDRMFDLRPMKETGDLDVERIKKIQDFLDLRYERWSKKKNRKRARKDNAGKIARKELVSNPDSSLEEISLKIFEKALAEAGSVEFLEEILPLSEETEIGRGQNEDFIDALNQEILSENRKEVSVEPEFAEEPAVEALFLLSENKPVPIGEPVLEIGNYPPEPELGHSRFQGIMEPKGLRRTLLAFAGAGLMVLLVVSGLSLAGRGFSAQNSVLSSALQAYEAMLQAKNSAKNLDFSGAQTNFETALQNFLQAEQEINNFGGVLVSVLSKLPLTSKIGSADALLQAGEAIAKAGSDFADAGGFLTDKNFNFLGGDSLTEKISQIQEKIKDARLALNSANNNLAKVNSADLPENFVSSVEDLKAKMPVLLGAAQGLENWSQAALEILGQNRAKKYLLIFQNPSEARPTGGFIGTYGVMDVDRGRIKNLLIDGVFNLDGQLLEKVTPPAPIQKISTAWSMHDANWFADFALSAQKIMWFFEKGGGETADGVISLTPAVFEKLLAITGPVELPQYNATLSADNFLETVQTQVEIGYDKELNRPKKILADFAPLFLDKLKAAGQEKSRDILKILADELVQKDILFYFSDPKLQKVFSAQGWSGEILPTDKDYLNVINTNINGFKTDEKIEQKISLETQIQPDGSLIDTVKITRTHQGGQTPYDWYNRVNADYLRVYAPLGSKLLSAQGQTLEINPAPIDYRAQGFENDPDVLAQEQGLKIDPNSGTQIFEESGKTVFGNWVYVSPGKTVELTYQYLLPFKINLNEENSSWGLLAQKQAGAKSSTLETEIIFPAAPQIKWQYPANLEISGNSIKFDGELDKDKFFGAVLTSD